MSRKRLLNDVERQILSEIGSNLGEVSVLLEEYRNHTYWSVRAARALVLDAEEELSRLAKGDYRRGRHIEEGGAT
jgi:hypothetical protein